MELLFIQQISSNGLISFNRSFTSYTPTKFPLSASLAVLAPFWDDIDLFGSRELRYQVISGSSPLITQVNNFLFHYTGISFNAHWLLWAYWHDVCPFTDRNCTSHQVYTNSCCHAVYVITF